MSKAQELADEFESSSGAWSRADLDAFGSDCIEELRRLESEYNAALANWQSMQTATQPPRKPLTDEQLRKMHHEDQFGLFCDYDEFEQIARAIEQAHGITGGQA